MKPRDRTHHFRDGLKSRLTGTRANLESQIKGMDLLLKLTETLDEDESRCILRVLNT